MEKRDYPALVGSRTSGVDGSSEGGRISSVRMPHTLVLYSVPLLAELRRAGYKGNLTSEPVLQDGVWCLKVIFEGERPQAVPDAWHGHTVILERRLPHRMRRNE